MFVRPILRALGLARQARAGDGWLAQVQPTTMSTDSNQTITVPAILGGLWVRSGTNTNRTDTTATAAAILAALPDMDIGDTYLFMVANTTANPVVVAGGTNVTASGNLTVATLTTKFFLLTKTSATEMTMLGM